MALEFTLKSLNWANTFFRLRDRVGKFWIALVVLGNHSNMLYNVILFEAPKVTLVVACCHYCFTRGWSGNFGTHVWTSRWVSIFCAQLGNFLSNLPSVKNNPKISWTVSNSASWNYFSFDATWCDIATWVPDMTWWNANGPERTWMFYHLASGHQGVVRPPSLQQFLLPHQQWH